MREELLVDGLPVVHLLLVDEVLRPGGDFVVRDAHARHDAQRRTHGVLSELEPKRLPGLQIRMQ